MCLVAGLTLVGERKPVQGKADRRRYSATFRSKWNGLWFLKECHFWLVRFAQNEEVVTYVNRPHNAMSILCDTGRCSSCMRIPATATEIGQDIFFVHAILVIQQQRQGEHKGDRSPCVFDFSAHLRISPPDHAQTLEEREQRALGHLSRVAGLPPGRESP